MKAYILIADASSPPLALCAGEPALLQPGAQTVWRAPRELQTGDQIFLLLREPSPALHAAGVARENAKPGEYWAFESRIEITHIIQPPISLEELRFTFPQWTWPKQPRRQTVVPVEHQPRLSGMAHGDERLPHSHFQTDPSIELETRAILDDPHLSPTERTALIQARIGQGQFRSALLQYWQGCAITGIKNPALLRASHIKPWTLANNHERLDPYNGLLLSAHYDAAFDAGLISFSDQGLILRGADLKEQDAEKLGFLPNQVLRTLEPKHLSYLQWHRAEYGFS